MVGASIVTGRDTAPPPAAAALSGLMSAGPRSGAVLVSVGEWRGQVPLVAGCVPRVCFTPVPATVALWLLFA